jgi:hypothetical protein
MRTIKKAIEFQKHDFISIKKPLNMSGFFIDET